MSTESHCCTTWRELSVELSVAKEGELNELMASHKLPRSMFASVFKVLGTMSNYCPVCGTTLNAELIPKLKQQHQAAVKAVASEVAEPAPTLTKQRCAACGGKGILGIDRNKVKINCIRCHGSGVLESKHLAVDSRAALAQSKVDQVREEKGIGDGAVNIDAAGTEE